MCGAREREWARRLISLVRSPPDFLPFPPSISHLLVSVVASRLAFPICVTPESEITGSQTPFCFTRVSQRVKSWKPGARKNEERGRYARWEETDGAPAERYDGRIRRLRIRISFRLGAKEHLPISRCNRTKLCGREASSTLARPKRESYEAERWMEYFSNLSGVRFFIFCTN